MGGTVGLGPAITLTTDFGLRDPYVGVMKGVILSIAPGTSIVDLTHAIPPQNLREGNFAVRGAVRYFAPGTIHVVVVDPGVGSDRRILAVRSSGSLFLAPDNGVLTGLLGEGAEVRHLTNEKLFRPSISRTFHGRDIFAPVAAHLAKGVPFEELGPAIRDAAVLDLPAPVLRADGVLVGLIVHVDAFGNLITNVDAARLAAVGLPVAKVEMLGFELDPPCAAYSTVDPGRPLTIVDSFDFLEVALRGGSAASHFNAGVGDEIRVRFGPRV